MAGRRGCGYRLAPDQIGRPAVLRRQPQESHRAGSARPPPSAAGAEPSARGQDLAAGPAGSGPGPAMAGFARLSGMGLRLLALLAVVLVLHMLALEWLSL